MLAMPPPKLLGSSRQSTIRRDATDQVRRDIHACNVRSHELCDAGALKRLAIEVLLDLGAENQLLHAAGKRFCCHTASSAVNEQPY